MDATLRVAEVGDRRSRELVATLVIIIAVLAAIATTARTIADPAGAPTAVVVPVAVLASLGLISWLNRGRHHRLAAFLFCVGPIWTNLIEGLRSPQGPIWYGLIPLGVILGGGLLRPRAVIVLAVVGPVVALTVVLARADVVTADRGLLIVFYVAATSGIAAGMAQFRARVEAARHAEVERLSAQLASADRLESIGRLAGGVAHDFNNLLAVMMLSAEAVRAGQLDALDDLTSAGDRAAALTRQLLAFSHHRGGQRIRVRVDHAIESLRPLLRRLMPENQELTFALEAAATVELEDQQLEQLVINLAANARDAMPKGGRIEIATAVIEVAAGAAPPRQPGTFVALTVRDHGVGIDPTDQAHLFEPFFTTKPLGQGTGLGLASVYGIVRRAGGWVEVDSAPARGTLVTIALPVATPSVVLAPVASSVTARFDALVLLVEDEPLLRRSTRRLLEKLGLTVLVAGDAAEARTVLAGEARPLALLVTDIVMPGPSGIELARELRATRPALPVLLVSGYAADDLDGALREPATRFLAKPFTFAQLAGAVGALIASARVGAAS